MKNTNLIMGKEMLIDCKKLRDNISKIKEDVGGKAKIIAVIKGNAYGHGIGNMATELSKNEDVSMLAVSSFDEAKLVSYQKKPILVMYPVVPEEIARAVDEAANPQHVRHVIENKIIFTISNTNEIDGFERVAKRKNLRIQVHARLDFRGGARGLDRQSAMEQLMRLRDIEEIRLCGLYAHVYAAYSSESLAEEEFLEYAEFVEALDRDFRQTLMVHFLTSVSFFNKPKYIFDAIRVGAAVYGMPVSEDPKRNSRYECVMQIRSQLVNIVELDKDAKIDYSDEKLESVKRIGIVPIGNWDIPHFFQGETCRVSINGQLTTTAGSPCMDTCCIDLSELKDVKVGDIVYFLGDRDGIDFVSKMKENNYEVKDCQMLYVGIDRLPKTMMNRER